MYKKLLDKGFKKTIRYDEFYDEVLDSIVYSNYKTLYSLKLNDKYVIYKILIEFDICKDFIYRLDNINLELVIDFSLDLKVCELYYIINSYSEPYNVSKSKYKKLFEILPDEMNREYIKQ